jgi:Sortase domain
MIRHRTFTSLLLAVACGAVLLVLLGAFTPGPADPAVSEAPRSLRLPSGRVVPVHPVSTTRDGQLDVPDDPRIAGWWRGSSGVGDQFGKTFLAAHIDSPLQRLGPFVELYDARPGLPLVLRSAGLRQGFRIRSVRLIPRESLTAHPDLYSRSGTRRLVLVTCAPPYDLAHGGYRNLVVLVAQPSGPPTPKPAG